MAGVVFGGETSLTGFSSLESEPTAGYWPLLARWEDRVVFAFPLLVVLQRNNFPLDGMEIRPGEYLKLSPDGPIVPLDKYGRLALPLKPMAAFKEISADALIDGGDTLFPKSAPDPIILRDDQSSAEPATRAFSKKLSAMVAAIGSHDAFARSYNYPRLTLNHEFCVLTFAVIALTLLCGLADFARHATFALFAALCLSAQWIGVGMASVWLPGLPILAAIAAALIPARFIGRACFPETPSAVVPAEPSVPSVPASVEPASPEKKARAPRAKKAPSEKPPAKKAAAKKTPAKKAATPRKPRAKKPPGDT
jgi:hypothetical protein